jgi:hypothetical protein
MPYRTTKATVWNITPRGEQVFTDVALKHYMYTPHLPIIKKTHTKKVSLEGAPSYEHPRSPRKLPVMLF